MKKLISVLLSLLICVMCFYACGNQEKGDESSVASSATESKDESSKVDSNSESSNISDTSSETSEPEEDLLDIIYYQYEIPFFYENLPEKGANTIDNNGIGIDEYLAENDVSNDSYFAVGLKVTEGVTLETLTQMGFINEPKAVKCIRWLFPPMNDMYELPLDFVGYINKSTYNALCENQSFGTEIIWISTSVIKYGSAVVSDVDSLKNIVYYTGEYSGVIADYINTSGVREIYSSGSEGIANYISENEIADDVYFPVGISINGSYEGVYWKGFADDLPEMFGFVKDKNAKLNFEFAVDYDHETFVVSFDVVGYVNKSTFEKMQDYNIDPINLDYGFGMEVTWLPESHFEK